MASSRSCPAIGCVDASGCGEAPASRQQITRGRDEWARWFALAHRARRPWGRRPRSGSSTKARRAPACSSWRRAEPRSPETSSTSQAWPPRLFNHCRVTTGAAPCTLAQSDVEASRCGCFAHAMHSVQGAARCANHRDAPRCRCTQVVMHRGARCTSVHGDARRAKMRCLSQYLTSLVFLVLLQCCPRVKETFNRAGMHLGAGAHSVQ